MGVGVLAMPSPPTGKNFARRVDAMAMAISVIARSKILCCVTRFAPISNQASRFANQPQIYEKTEVSEKIFVTLFCYA